MPDREHLARLAESLDKWNAWRAENPAVVIDLTGARLENARLARANLIYADLTEAGLTEANLTGADLTGADLTGAGLEGANLRHANLTRANLSGADLERADLSGANLTRADLTGVDLERADLTDADLTEAGLRDANLCYAKLRGTNLIGLLDNSMVEQALLDELIETSAQEWVVGSSTPLVDGNVVRVGGSGAVGSAEPQAEPVVVNVLLPDDDADLYAERIETALRDALREAGMHCIAYSPPEKGSWYKKLLYAALEKNVLPDLYRAFKSVFSEENASGPTPKTLAPLVSTFADIDNVVVRIGNLLLVKFTERGKSSLMCSEITPALAEEMANNPSVLKSPKTVFSYLKRPAAAPQLTAVDRAAPEKPSPTR